jgi:hypothetical protein
MEETYGLDALCHPHKENTRKIKRQRKKLLGQHGRDLGSQHLASSLKEKHKKNEKTKDKYFWSTWKRPRVSMPCVILKRKTQYKCIMT